MPRDKSLEKTAELVAAIERLQATLAAAKANNRRLDASIAERKAEAEARYSDLFGVTWKWGDPSPMDIEEFEGWLAQRKPDYVRTRFKPGDPPRSIIAGPNGQAISIPENRLGDIEQWFLEGSPSNAPATTKPPK